MTLEKALDHLRHQDSFIAVLEELSARMEDVTRELPEADVGQVDRLIGKLAAYQEIMDTFTG